MGILTQKNTYMSDQIKTTVNTPFDWLAENPWDYIALYSEEEIYTELDDMSRIITCSDKEDISEDIREYYAEMNEQEMKAYYRKHFPLMFGEALIEIGKAIINGDINLFVNFEEEKDV